MYSETILRLDAFTDPGEFERLGCDLLSRLGYRGIEPQGVGGKDGGKDALHVTDDGIAVIHFSLRKDWDKKIMEDLETSKKSERKYKKFVFVSNRFIPPTKRDKLKELIRSQYGWDPVIMDRESLRVELDNHHLDLRKKYLAIPEDQKSEIAEIIDDFIEKRDEYSNYLTKSRFVRLLLLSIPNNLYDNRLKLYDDKMKFVGEKEKLESILAENLLSGEFQSKIRSDSLSTYYISPKRGILFGIGHDNIYEANLYHNGLIEIFIDLEFWVIDEKLINTVIINFFKTIGSIYPGIIDDKEIITLVACFINTEEMRHKKKNGKKYTGEKYFLYHELSEKLGVIMKTSFCDNFLEILHNKIDNFFNI